MVSAVVGKAAIVTAIVGAAAGLCWGEIAFAGQAQAGENTSPRAMTAVDMIELPALSSPSLSRDGSIIAYLQKRTNWKRDRKVDRIVLRDVRTGQAIKGPPTPGALRDQEDVYWSPNAESFITIARMEGDKDKQVYLYSVASQKVKRLTNHPTDISAVRWAPDGAGFYFESDNIDQAKVDHSWAPRPYEDRDYDQLFYYDLAAGTARSILGGDFVISSFDVSRDGRHLLVARRAQLPKNQKEQNEVWMVDVGAGEPTKLTANGYDEVHPRLSPNDQYFAFIATVNEAGENYYEDNLFIQRVGESKPELLFPKKTMEVVDFAWDRAGTGLFILGNIGLTTQLFHYDIASHELRQITHGEQSITQWQFDPASGRHIARVENANNPGDIFAVDPTTGALTNLSREFADFAQRFALPRQEAVSWTSVDGQKVEGLLAYPLDYKPGQRFPLVTISHGGPRVSVNFGSWKVSRYVSVLAAQGYGVFQPNYRGSVGYGDAFMRDMVGEYFHHSDDDVLSGIDDLIARGLVDSNALIAMGWSAGGHMTNWLIGHTDRFKAASSGAGASDWVSMYGESDFRYLRTFNFGGTPWQQNAPIENYRENSPLTYAWRVHTPTLLFSGEDDVRVPPTQNILMYHALKDAGTPTEFYEVKSEPHNFRKPRNQLFKINRELEWYAHYLGSTAYTPVLPAEATASKN